MPLDFTTVSVTLLAVLILGLSKGGFAGIGMVAMPLLSLVLPPSAAAGILLPILIFQDAISVYAYRRSFSGWNLAVLLPGGIIGILLGAATVSLIDRAMFELVLGSISLCFGIERVIRYFGGVARPHVPHRAVGAVCGGLAGFTSMIAHAGVPPFQFFVLPQRLPRDVYIGTSVLFYGAVNMIKLPFFLSLGQIGRESALVSAALFPLALASVMLGIFLVRRISSDRYILVANIILVGIGLLLILRGLSG